MFILLGGQPFGNFDLFVVKVILIVGRMATMSREMKMNKNNNISRNAM